MPATRFAILARNVLLSLVVAFLSLASASAQAFPKPVGYVNDFAGLMPTDTRAQLETLLQQFNQETTVEIAVVTVPTLGGDTIEDYAVHLFQDWGIGKKGVDNGVLLLVAQQERDVRIEVGYGMEPYITDGQAGQILDTAILPDLHQNNYTLGILKGVQGIEQTIQASGYQPGSVRPPPTPNPLADAFQNNLWLLISLGVASIYLFNFFSRSKAIWAGGVWGAVVGGSIGWIFGGLVVIIIGVVAAGFLGLLLDVMLSTAYRHQVSTGKPTAWHQSWGGFNGAGRGGWGGWGGGSSGGGGFGGFGGGHSGGGGASRGF